jgi:type I restriction enzyme S subunit
MAGEWCDTTLGDVLTLQRGFDLPEADRKAGPYPVIASTGPVGTHDEPMVHGPGVVIGRSGSLGGGQFITGDFWPLNTTLWVKDFKGNDRRFCYYLLKSLDLAHFNAGSGVPTLNRNHIHPLPVTVPKDLREQRAIAHILGTLDDKIELNRRMSETLEAMARALFRSWFVDFDPVRAKAEGRDPGLPQPLADLFPDSFEDSELGEIPRGWEVGTLGDVADNPRRGVQPSSIRPDTPYIALEHMPKHCIALSDWDVADGLESNKFEFRKGEILFGKLRPYFHKVGVAPVDGVCSTDIVVVAPRLPHWFAFVLGVVSSDEFVEYTNAGSTGTKMPRTSWAEMARYEIALPPQAVAQAFTERVRPAVDRMIVGIHESRTLASLRDALLPKLISGELRVKDAEKFIGKAS